ncbi:MAG: c-type cytochrome [Candidatus Acidiferrales bacterium]
MPNSGLDRVTSKRLCALGVMMLFILASSMLAQPNRATDVSVTPVTGESWLTHLHRPFAETSMGKTWILGPTEPEPGEALPQWQLELSPSSATQMVSLHGSDLYRLNCQGCHGSSGQGAPPEINSVINPVRATSVALIMERSKQTGQDMSRADAAVLASQARTLLLQRFHNGGVSMPPFPQLGEPEIRSIVAYLEQLAEIPGAQKRQITIKESDHRVGEFIVKSTCHICHGSAGPNPDPQELLDGAIPPLSTLTRRMGLPEFVRKVTRGAPIVMGMAPFSYQDSYRGRMPVFVYLTPEEAADAYLYLTVYPPN